MRAVPRLLSTTSLAFLTLGAGPLAAAEVNPGGALDIEISGFARFLAIGGDVDNFQLDRTLSTGLDFFNDTELHVTAEGGGEAGPEYGGTVEFEADTDQTANTDETWVFLKGGFGEVRLGDEDGAADFDGLAVSAAELSSGVGTDGLEGDQFEAFLDSTKTYEPLGTSDATKIRYYTPSFGGLQLGASYTPNLDSIGSGSGNGSALATTDVEAGDVVEGAARYETDLGGFGLIAGVSGLYGDIKDEDEAGGDDYWAVQAGAVIEVAGVSIGGSYLREEVGAFEGDAITAGVGAELGAVTLALTYGQFIRTDDLVVNDNEVDHPYLIILSGTVGLLPGLTLAGDVAYFDNDVKGDTVGIGGDDGVQAVGRLGVAF